MSEQIGTRFNNQVLKKLNKSSINKFQDAQTGNFAVILELYQNMQSEDY